MTFGMAGDSRTVLRDAELLFVVEKAVPPRVQISIRYTFAIGTTLNRDDGCGAVATEPDSFQIQVERRGFDWEALSPIKER
jgi:hypothetical protein